MSSAQPNRSLIDGLGCLQALAAQPAPLGSRELGRLLGLEPTRVNRLLKTLAHVGLAQQDAQRKYSPGPAVHVLAAQSLFGSGLIRRAIGPLEDLLPLGHVVALGVLWRGHTCYLYHAGPRDDRRGHGLAQEPPYPAAHSGLGWALLATRTDDEVRALHDDLAAPLTSLTERLQLEGEGGLLHELERTRRRGHALTPIDQSSHRTIGVVLQNSSTAAIGLSGDFADDEIPALAQALHDAAARIDDPAAR